MKSKKEFKNDELMTNSPTTGSVATSGSANLTAESSGLVGSDDKSLLPHFGKPTEWYSKTEKTVGLTPDIKFRNKK